MAKELRGGLSRRELLQRALLIGSLSALYFSSAHAETSLDDQAIVAAVPAAGPLNVATGDFFPSAFVTAPDLLNPDGSPKVGYRVGGETLSQYQRNRRTWGAVRTNDFEFQGAAAQLFENALIVGGEPFPVRNYLTSQGLGPWLEEYGFEKDVPVWKTAVASGLVPPEALIPIGREIDQRIPSQITQDYLRLSIHNYDPLYRVIFDQHDYIDRLLAITGGDTRINFHFVSSEPELPAALGRWSIGQDRQRPWVGNIVGTAPMQEYMIQSANQKDYDYWVALSGLHIPELTPESALQNAIGILGRVQGGSIATLIKDQPFHKWQTSGWVDGDLSPQQIEPMKSYVADLVKNGIIIFEVAFCNDSQTCPT